MRRDIIYEGVEQLKYEIREIVRVANRLQEMGLEITWENIGDPIHKGEELPKWIKNIIKELAMKNPSYGYVATTGVPETRKFIADHVNQRGGCQITPEDIIFYNGLGDAVAKIYGFLRREARVIVPSPAYTTHSSAEASHSGHEPIVFELNPRNNWIPNLEELENKVKYNESITGIAVINPDNPTGMVYPKEILKKIVHIAKRYDLFVIFDEIYTNIIYDNQKTARLCEVIDDVPGLALRGISKEYPWPGGRCGWIEVYNQDKHPMFKRYINTLITAKMLEVCSTSLPQHSIPLVMGDPRYKEHLESRKKIFEKRATEAYGIFSKVEGIYVNKPQGAFYMSILFEDNILSKKQTLPIKNSKAKIYIEDIVKKVAPDKRFAYYLLGSTGICVVPITGFSCRHYGFRVTMLECDDEKRRRTWETIANSICQYLKS